MLTSILKFTAKILGRLVNVDSRKSLYIKSTAHGEAEQSIELRLTPKHQYKPIGLLASVNDLYLSDDFQANQ